MLWIDAREIENWADLHEAASILPALVRRLYVATVSNPSSISIPSGSSVYLSGWDGRAESDGGPFVPKGKVVFEMSCRTGVGSKAQEDYDKRTSETPETERKDTTYIFVTPRVWPDKVNWIRKRSEEQSWKNVKALDATDLAQWLDISVSTSSWFARIMGKVPPTGFITLNDYWEQWSKATNPPVNADLLIAGRESQLKNLVVWAKGEPSKFFVQGELKDESIAFVAACAIKEDSVREIVFARSVVVTSQDAWLTLSAEKMPLLLIPLLKGDYAVAPAISAGHHVLVPIERGDTPAGNGSVLPRSGRDDFIQALQAMGLRKDDAEKLASTTGRHLPTLKRRLIDRAGGPKPLWAAQSPRKLLPALLVGQWTETEGDMQVLSKLGRSTQEEFLSIFQEYTNQSDAPLRKIGNRWRLTSHEEAWELLSPLLTKSDLEKFASVAQEILSELSPALDLNKDERYLANVKGKIANHSGILIEGISVTLALMGCRSETLDQSIQDIPRHVLRTVLEQNASDWRFWATIEGVLPTLAEAAPDQMLCGVEEALQMTPSPFLELFRQEGDGFWGGCYHSGLLWGLERIAWSSEYFARVAIALARLTHIDPGGRYSNRPLESLKSLFMAWIRFSDAKDEERIKVLGLLIDRVPEAAWKLLIEIIPGRRDTIIVRQPPLWRPWGYEVSKHPTREERNSYDSQVIECVFKAVGNTPAKWEELLKHVPTFPKVDDQVAALDVLGKVTIEIKDVVVWIKVREEIRQTLYHH